MQSKNLHPLLEYFFPRFCKGCGIPGVHICATCLKKIDTCRTQKCYKCHKPSPYGMVHWGCRRGDYVIGVFSFMFYRGLGGRVVKYAKYKRQDAAIADLFYGASFTQHLALYDFFMRTNASVLIPIPLHKSIINTRGFNQSVKICQYISHTLGIPSVMAVEKVVERCAQSKLSPRMRKKNVHGAYVLNRHTMSAIEGRRVCIVDDVITTGATLEEVSSVLMPYVKEVYGITLLRSFE